MNIGKLFSVNTRALRLHDFIEAKKWLSDALRIVKKLEASSGAFIQDKRQTPPFIHQLLSLNKVGGFYSL